MIAVTGASGQLGSALVAASDKVVGLTRSSLDLSEPDRLVQVLNRLEPTGLINCAAYTAVDQAETEEDLAATINGEAVGVMAEWAFRNDVPFVSYSTDYVFDGSMDRPYVEEDRPQPINAYGRSKLLGERFALSANSRALVIRTSWVLSGTHPNFVSSMIRNARSGPFSVVDDQWGRPTHVQDLVDATFRALDVGASGIVHITNAGDTTWFRLAQEIIDAAGLDSSLVAPCDSQSFSRPAPRPVNSRMESTRLERLGLSSLPPWQRRIPEVVDQVLQWL